MKRSIAAFVLALAAPALAGPRTADQHREAGYRHAEHGEWDDALAEYQAAYDLDHDPVSLYAIGRVHVRRGDCVQAIDAFRRFLASDPPPRARASAEGEIATCEATLAAAAPPPEPPPPVEPPPPPPPPRAHHRPFYADPIGDVLVGGGAVAAGLGVYFYVRARGELCDDPCTGSYQAYQDSVSRAHTWRTTAVIAGGVGGALIIAGAIRWATHRERAPVDVTVAPQAGGGALLLGGRF